MLAYAAEGGEVQEHGSAPTHNGKEEGAGACVKDRLPGVAWLYTYFVVMNSPRELAYSVPLEYHYLSMRMELYNPSTS